MKQLQRLRLIYTLLKEKQISITGIKNHLADQGSEISRRQLERDLADVENYFLQNQEEFLVTKVKKEKQYLIVSTKKNFGINGGGDSRIVNSNFYEIKKNTAQDLLIGQLLHAISLRKLIIILEIKGDSTVDNHLLHDKTFELAPIRLLYHRGQIHVIGFDAKNLNELLIYGIDQLVHVHQRQKSFNYDLLSARADSELLKRFGITKNVDNAVYDIQLEFSNLTGAFIKKFHWHPTQKFEQKAANEKVIMHMKCGINRELVGWILQWIYNVKIISPPILNEYYTKSIDNIIALHSEKSPMVYRNIFEPKV